MSQDPHDHPGPARATPSACTADLLQVFVKTLRRLGQAGHPDDASRLAAQAWSLLRHDDPVAAERLNGTMHYLARLDDAPAPTLDPKES